MVNAPGARPGNGRVAGYEGIQLGARLKGPPVRVSDQVMADGRVLRH